MTSRLWALVGVVAALPARAKPKLPTKGQQIPDIEEILSAAGWTMTPEMSAKFSRPGDILDGQHATLLDGPRCFSAEVEEGAYATMEVTRSMAAGVRMRTTVVGARAGMALEKKLVFDTPIYRQIPRLALTPSDKCLATLRNAEARDDDISDWYVITESLSAIIQQQQCGSYDAKVGAFVVSGEASVQEACSQTSLDPVAVAYKTIPVSQLLASTGRTATPLPAGIVTETGQAEVEVGGDVDFATLAARAAQAKAVREQREAELADAQARLDADRAQAARAVAAEQARLADQEQRAKADLVAAQQAKLETAKQELIAKAQQDLAALQPLLEMKPTDETRPVLSAFLDRYARATVRVDDLVEAVEVPGVAAVRRVLGISGFENSVGMIFAPIKLGTFTMGDLHPDRHHIGVWPSRPVTLTIAFELQTTEVTQRQWEAVMGKNPSRVSSDRNGNRTDLSAIGDNLPVQGVSWLDAVEFANKLSEMERFTPTYEISGKRVAWDRSANGYRLPTQAEWEYAARAGQQFMFVGTDEREATCRYGNVSTPQLWTVRAESGRAGCEGLGSKGYRDGWRNCPMPCEDEHLGLAPVGSYKPNAWGLYDMMGNVDEWCWDYLAFSLTFQHDATDPQGPKTRKEAMSGGKYRVVRGGSYIDKARDLRVAWEGGGAVTGRRLTKQDRGLRLARTVP